MIWRGKTKKASDSTVGGAQKKLKTADSTGVAAGVGTRGDMAALEIVCTQWKTCRQFDCGNEREGADQWLLPTCGRAIGGMMI